MRAIDPSGLVISQMTPTGERPPRRQRSTAASVWPARTRTPPSRAWSGKMCPGLTRSREFVRGSARTLMVCARSLALIPVVTPSRASTLTVKAVPRRASFRETICGSSSSCRRSAVIGTQITPLAYFLMKATSSAVASSAAIVRSPSFSRSSSSTTMTIFPRRMSSMASGTVAKGLAGATTLGRLVPARTTFLTLSSLERRSRLSDETLHVLRQHVRLDVDEVAGRERAERRLFRGVGDESDLEEGLAEAGDRQRDPVEGDEALHHDVAGDGLWQREAEPRRAAAFLAARHQPCRGVDVSLYEVPTQCGRWRRGGLEVDPRSPDGPAERGPRDRLGDDVDREPVGVALDNGEAGSGHVDAGVDPQVRRHPRGCDLEPQARGVWPRMADGPDLLDDPGEHLSERSFQREVVTEPADSNIRKVAGLGNALGRRWSVAAGNRGDEEQDPIGETAAHQRSRDMRPGLAHHRIHAMLTQPPHHRAELDATARARGSDEQHSGLAKLVRAANVGVTGHEDHGALRIPSAYDLCRGRRPRVGVDDDAQWISSFDLANRERWIIGEHGADPDEHRVEPVAQTVNLAKRGLSR